MGDCHRLCPSEMLRSYQHKRRNSIRIRRHCNCKYNAVNFFHCFWHYSKITLWTLPRRAYRYVASYKNQQQFPVNVLIFSHFIQLATTFTQQQTRTLIVPLGEICVLTTTTLMKMMTTTCPVPSSSRHRRR